MANTTQTEYGTENVEFILKLNEMNDTCDTLIRMSADFYFQSAYMLEKGIIYGYDGPYRLIELKKTYKFKTPEKTYLIKKNDTKRLTQITIKYIAKLNITNQKKLIENYKNYINICNM